jgi:hypothetical protein
MYRRALKAREKVLGSEHPHALTVVTNLGNVLSRQGKYDKAEQENTNTNDELTEYLGTSERHKTLSVNLS